MDEHAMTAGRRMTLQRLAGAALMDETFRRRLRDDPKGAAESIGIDLTDDALESIRGQLQEVDWEAVETLSPLVRASLPRVREVLDEWGHERVPFRRTDVRQDVR
jgi:hypothetical protein